MTPADQNKARLTVQKFRDYLIWEMEKSLKKVINSWGRGEIGPKRRRKAKHKRSKNAKRSEEALNNEWRDLEVFSRAEIHRNWPRQPRRPCQCPSCNYWHKHKAKHKKRGEK